jgi:hypothetical protein
MAVGCTLLFGGVTTALDTTFDWSPAINQGFVANTTQISLPASLLFMVTGFGFILTSMRRRRH